MRIFNIQYSIFNKKAFTLVELIIAITLFTLIAFVSIGAVLSIFDASRKARSSKTVVDNLNFSLENMTRIVRFGSNYYCGVSSNISSVNDCAAGSDSISITFKGSRIIYRLNGTAIQRSDDGGSSYTNITSSDTVIQYLKFYVIGSSTSDANQPYIIAVIKGYVGSKPTVQSMFSMETLMSQRVLDIL